MLILNISRANDENRTHDLIPTKDALYHLSYVGNFFIFTIAAQSIRSYPLF